MSDTFVLCPKCGEEVEIKGLGRFKFYYCENCKKARDKNEVRIENTEYLKGEEDEKGNQSRRSKE